MTATNATYAKLMNLRVEANGVFSANAGGNDGITLTVDKGGTATINTITNLKPSVIAGTLISNGFTALPDTSLDAPSTPLSAVAGAIINGITFTGETTNVTALTFAAGTPPTYSVTTEDFVVPVSTTLTIPAGGTLIVAEESTLTYEGQLTLEAHATAGGKLVLTAGTVQANVAKIVGNGTITAGATDITGAWEPVAGAAAGTLTIQSAPVATTGAIITATTATGLRASAIGAPITQKVASGSTLAIGLTTAIELAGTTDEKIGEIRLRAASSNAAKLSLGIATGKIVGGATGSTNIGGVATVTIGGKSAVLGGMVVGDCKLDAAPGHLVSIQGGGSAVGTITAGTTDDVLINSVVLFSGS
jgi:hypothetical protein